jgi:glucosamine--fructose-6-phosphate aminotransferase (isomerizing)
MAMEADRHLNLDAGPELAVAATKSYTSELLALAALSVAMTGDESLEASLRWVPPAVSETLERSTDLEGVVDLLRPERSCVVIGRGYNHSTAFEWALKITELTYLAAQPFSAADFRHGPIAMVEPGLVVLAVVTDGPVYEDVAGLLTQIGGLGATTIAITDRNDCPAQHLIPVPPGTPEWLSPMTATVAAQVFTYRLALARDLDPDQPRGLHKVTRTE